MFVQDNMFSSLFNHLSNVNYGYNIEIVEIEKEISRYLEIDPKNLWGNVVHMHCFIMMGNITKSKEIAQKIWEIGGSLSIQEEKVYINNLLNLGLLDMAKILLSDKINHLSVYLESFKDEILKYLLITGDFGSFDRLSEIIPDSDLVATVAVYNHLSLGKHFAAIQKIVLSTVSDGLCLYEYKTFTDRGFPEVELMIYLNKEQEVAKDMQKSMDKKIDAFWLTSGANRLNNLIVTINHVSKHKMNYHS